MLGFARNQQQTQERGQPNQTFKSHFNSFLLSLAVPLRTLSGALGVGGKASTARKTLRSACRAKDASVFSA